MPGLLIRMPDRNWLDAHSSTYSCQRRRIEAEQLPQHALAAQRIADLAQVHQRHVGVGRGGDGLQQPRRDRGQEVPAAARREKADLLVRQRHQVLIGLRNVAKRIAAQHLGDPLARRIGIEHQVDLRLGLVVVAEGVVQQVVENLAVQLGLLR